MKDKSIEEIRDYLKQRIEQEKIQIELDRNTNLVKLFNWLENKEYILEMNTERYLTVYQMDMENNPEVKDGKWVGRKIIDSYSLMCDCAKDEDEMENLSMHRQFKNDKSNYFKQDGKFWNAEDLKELQECDKNKFMMIKSLHDQTQKKFKEILSEYYQTVKQKCANL